MSSNSQVLTSHISIEEPAHRQQQQQLQKSTQQSSNGLKSFCSTSTPLRKYATHVVNNTTSTIPTIIDYATSSSVPLIANTATTITNTIGCSNTDQSKQLSEILKNSTIDDDLPRLAQELKYRELFKGTSKFDGKAFQHFFLAQELKTNALPTVNDTINDDHDSNDSNSTNSGSKHSTTTSSKHHEKIKNQDVNKNAIWNLSFSPDGKYLASAGEDGIIRIWEIISSVLDRDELNFTNTENLSFDESDHTPTNRKNSLRSNGRHRNSFSNGAIPPYILESMSRSSSASNQPNNNNNINNNSNNNSTNYNTTSSSPYAPVFKSAPIREFRHSDSVLSIDWSKNNFLISSSIDKTVKLWHVDRSDCLSEFKVDPYVTAVKFHKSDDRFFVSGSISGVVNVWSILDKEIVYEYKIGKILTCIEFSPDSEEIYVGGECGVFYILTTKGLIHVAHAFIKRRNKTPRVTGIESFKTENDTKVLVTTNDSRIRLFSHKEKLLNIRFKGLDNEQSTIKASINENQDYVISGSEDGWAYIWKLDMDLLAKAIENHHNKFGFDITSFFKDEDCLYKNRNYGAFHVHHSRCNSAIFAPRSTLKLLELSDDPVFDLSNKYKYLIKDTDNSENSNDLSTAIIVSTDNGGLIRVFRRDFAYPIRKFIKSKKLKSEIQKRALSSLSITRERSRSASNRRNSTDKHTSLVSILKNHHNHHSANNGNSNNLFNHSITIHEDVSRDSTRGREAYNNYSLMEKPQLASSIVNVLANKQDKLNPLSPQTTSFFPSKKRDSIDEMEGEGINRNTSSLSPSSAVFLDNNNNDNNNTGTRKIRSSTVASTNTSDFSLDQINKNDTSKIKANDEEDEGIELNFDSSKPSKDVPVETHHDNNSNSNNDNSHHITRCSNCNGEKFAAKQDINDKINFYCDSCGQRLI